MKSYTIEKKSLLARSVRVLVYDVSTSILRRRPPIIPSLPSGQDLALGRRLERGGRALQGRQGPHRHHDLRPAGRVRPVRRRGRLPGVLRPEEDRPERVEALPGRGDGVADTLRDLLREAAAGGARVPGRRVGQPAGDQHHRSAMRFCDCPAI